MIVKVRTNCSFRFIHSVNLIVSQSNKVLATFCIILRWLQSESFILFSAGQYHTSGYFTELHYP